MNVGVCKLVVIKCSIINICKVMVFAGSMILKSMRSWGVGVERGGEREGVGGGGSEGL